MRTPADFLGRTVSLALVVPLTLLTAQGAPAQAESVQVNDVALVYEVAGHGHPLVLIHGWAVHRGFWDGEVGPLARQYKVIRYDRRGFGESGGKPDLTADAADLKALLESLGHSRAHVMGHSQGGVVALTFALRYPEMVDSLLLFGSGPPIGLILPAGQDTPPVEEWVAVAKTDGVEAMKGAVAAWAAEQFGDSSAEVAARGRALMEPYSGLDLIDPPPPAHLADPARVSELGSVRVPTLVIRGEDELPSLQIVAATLAYGIPGARKVVIPGGGHAVNWSEPERFVAEVLRFLRATEEAAAGSPQ